MKLILTLSLLAGALIGLGQAYAASPHVTATWGGDQVKLIEIRTGKVWYESYDTFFANCGKHKPSELGVKVFGKLPPWYKGKGSVPPRRSATAPQVAQNMGWITPLLPALKTPTTASLLDAVRYMVNGEPPAEAATEPQPIKLSQQEIDAIEKNRDDYTVIPGMEAPPEKQASNPLLAVQTSDRVVATVEGVSVYSLVGNSSAPPTLPALEEQLTATGEDFDMEDLVKLVKRFEGFREKAYWDHAQYSIGYGTRAKSKSEVITEAQADARLRSHLLAASREVDAAAKKHRLSLNPNQRAALTSFHFNTGSIDRALELAGGRSSAVPSALQRWRVAGGKVNTGLVSRRAKEAKIYASN